MSVVVTSACGSPYQRSINSIDTAWWSRSIYTVDRPFPGRRWEEAISNNRTREKKPQHIEQGISNDKVLGWRCFI
jgi:hypothetical protein